MSLKKLCSYPGCTKFAIPDSSRCGDHQVKEREKRPFVGWMTDQQRAFYNSQRWRREKAEFLKDNPNCMICNDKATDVHHDWPDGYDYHNTDDFFDKTHWLALCSDCHDKISFASMTRRRKQAQKNRREHKLWY